MALALLGTAPAMVAHAMTLPGTVPPAPARHAPETEVAAPDPETADLTVVGGLWSLRPGATGTAFINVANGGPATALAPVLTVTLPKELSAADTSGCRQAASSITEEGVTTITCRWKELKPADNRLVPLKLRAAKATAKPVRPQVKLDVASDTPELVDEDNHSAFTVRIQPPPSGPARGGGR